MGRIEVKKDRASHKALVIDSEPETSRRTIALLAENGLEADRAMSGEGALKAINDRSYDVAICTPSLSDTSGIELLGSLRKNGFEAPYILYVSVGGNDAAYGTLNDPLGRTASDEGDLLSTLHMLGVIGDARPPTCSRQSSQQTEHAYRLMFQKGPFAASINEVDGRFVDVNERYIEISHFSRDEVIGKDPAELGFIDRTALDTLLQTIRGNERGLYRYPIDIKMVNGDVRHILVSANITEYQGVPRIFTVMDDVTDLVETKEVLRLRNQDLEEQRENLQRIADRVPDVVYQVILRPNCPPRFVFLSHRAEELVHLPTQTMLDDFNQVWERVYPDDRDPLLRSIMSLNEKSDHWTFEFRVIDLDGTRKWVRGSAAPSFSQAYDTMIWTGTFSDITKIKEVEEQLSRANRQLNLLTNVTRHDCLNKVSAALGYLDLATMTDLPPRAKDLLEKARRSIYGIKTEIDLTKELQEMTSLEPSWVGLRPLLSELPAPPEVTMNISCGNVDILANPMLKKVFLNLLDNSVRHGGKVTSIQIGCSMVSHGLLVTFEDNGVGIPDWEKTRIFDRGYGKNTGMGLFLVREILSSSGFMIAENGVKGKGARFEILVPNGYYARRSEAS